ncbi:lysoplasmalogenase [Pedobacter insulae]|uniref:Uncharacterized membrane protein YhhN n=1 Tax=Pedobacter insulae TaxID=414048 RepID=A0A1I3AIY7_9SPHI|nr:lysoplasmalogenase [Pedobacter insulae]SFH50044.1 Uncharacterized membrane protein YhhN [Pedobacter insulae]
MLKNHLGFNFYFALLFIVQLFTESDTLTDLFLFPQIHYFTKPLIAFSLFALLVYHTNLKGRFSKRIAAGLLFGLAGDIFLMFEDCFMYGLLSFLLGHIMYISAFFLDYKINTSINKDHAKNAVLGFGFFIILFCGGLWPYLGEMKIPVIIYAIAISAMGIMAFKRFGRVNSLSYKLIAVGAILFVLSDAFLAINRFAYSFKLSGWIIMATYMAAQYLITFGTMERRIKNKIEET